MPVTVFINNIVYHLNERKFKGLMISFSPIHAVRCQLRQQRKTNLFYLCPALMVVLQTLQESVQIPIKLIFGGS